MFFQVDIVAVGVAAVVVAVVAVVVIKIQVGTSFLRKYKFYFDAIYSVYTE